MKTKLSPEIPISLRRWIIGRDDIACQFVTRACELDPKRVQQIRETGVVTADERKRMQTFFNINLTLLDEALEASRRHWSELALLS